MRNKLLRKGRAFLKYCSVCIILLLSTILSKALYAETFKSTDFSIQTGITPQPTPFQPVVRVGFQDTQNSESLGLFLSTDLIDYGPLNPTNPIKRQLSISVDSGSAQGFDLFTYENHPLRMDEHTIPDTTCDTGSCTQSKTAPWVNPLTFGFGFSFDDRAYQQFADSSNQETIEKIDPGKMTIKLNVSQNQPLLEDKHYENTLLFILIPKF